MWEDLLLESGLTQREVRSIMVLGQNQNMRASELAKELDTTRLDAYNSLSRLQEMGIVTATADRPMRFSSLRIDEALAHIIEMRKTQLERLEEGYGALMSDIPEQRESYERARRDRDEPRFAVLKERVHIYRRIEQMAEESEERLVLMLGQFGILHLNRSPALEVVNTAAARGVVVQVLTSLDRRTVRFFDNLHESIEVRHSDDLESQGALQDHVRVIQFLNVESNPVGRGRDDAALVIDSEPFAMGHENLIDTIWDDAIQFDLAKARFTEDRIFDPLKLTIGEGSFLDFITDALGLEGDLPDEDTPFDPTAFMMTSTSISEARTELQAGKLQSLRVIGIDLPRMMRQVGNRIGHELAFQLRTIEGHIEFLSEMMDWWEHAGLGRLEYEIEPTFHVRVGLNQPPSKDPDALPMWELDDGIIEGALMTRYNDDKEILIRREDGEGVPDDLWRYHLLLKDQLPVAEA